MNFSTPPNVSSQVDRCTIVLVTSSPWDEMTSLKLMDIIRCFVLFMIYENDECFLFVNCVFISFWATYYVWMLISNLFKRVTYWVYIFWVLCFSLFIFSKFSHTYYEQKIKNFFKRDEVRLGREEWIEQFFIFF